MIRRAIPAPEAAPKRLTDRARERWRALRTAVRSAAGSSSQAASAAATAAASSKAYSYSIRFATESAEVPGDMRGVIVLMIGRIKRMAGHRIEIVAREEAAGQYDELAERRTLVIEALLRATGIDARRIRRRVSSGDSAAHVEVQLMPSVPSQARRPDEPPLSLEEVRLLGRVRRVLRFDCKQERRALEQQVDGIDWPRICGHESLESWASAGGGHPLYDA